MLNAHAVVSSLILAYSGRVDGPFFHYDTPILSQRVAYGLSIVKLRIFKASELCLNLMLFLFFNVFSMLFYLFNSSIHFQEEIIHHRRYNFLKSIWDYILFDSHLGVPVLIYFLLSIYYKLFVLILSSLEILLEVVYAFLVSL